MKYAIKLGKLIRGSKGQATISAAIILLVIGGILIPPCLGYAVASLKASQSGEQVLEGRYAADAGVEDAIWNINNGTPGEAYFLDEVNDRNVSVNVTQIKKGTYKIISTATSDSGGNTTIECYYGALDYSSLLDNAITSNDTLKIQPGNNITGNISTPDCTNVSKSLSCNSCASCPDWYCCVGCPNCTTCCSEEPISWPTAEELSAYYWADVKNLEPYTEDYIDIDTDPIIGPLYRNGTLDIYNGGTAGKNATLNGTVYVTGDLEIGIAPHPFKLNLNKQTIFVESNSTGKGHEAIKVGGNVNITGSGCIIAVGDIYFAPNGDVGSPGDFVLIMSIEGTVTLQPTGDFYGAVAGNAEVNLQPNNVLVWRSYNGTGIDFPIGQGMMKVFSYTIK